MEKESCVKVTATVSKMSTRVRIICETANFGYRVEGGSVIAPAKMVTDTDVGRTK